MQACCSWARFCTLRCVSWAARCLGVAVLNVCSSEQSSEEGARPHHTPPFTLGADHRKWSYTGPSRSLYLEQGGSERTQQLPVTAGLGHGVQRGVLLPSEGSWGRGQAQEGGDCGLSCGSRKERECPQGMGSAHL